MIAELEQAIRASGHPLRRVRGGTRPPEKGQAAMIVVCDMGPLHYLVLVGAEHVLPQIFGRVLTPRAVLAEMSHPDTPVAVRGWAAAPPQWLEVKEPTCVEDIPALGRKGARGRARKLQSPSPAKNGLTSFSWTTKPVGERRGKGTSNRFGCSKCSMKPPSGAWSATYHRSSNTLSRRPAST